jgi:tRNA A-37 threonylcarbamoyl transferase component Bud32
MPAPTNPVEMIDWLERNQLLLPDQAAELRPLLPTFPDVRLLAKELIRRDWLTPYAVNQLLTGKGDQLVLGCYRLCERLGEGAMGQVFKAVNTRLHTVVAVKTLHKDLVANARAMDRFRQEIEAAAQLDHPNIVKVRDADEIDSRPFMVMDYIDGVNLSHQVKVHGPLPIHTAAECARQAAVGLQHAFERGVVHRDIKPANLLMEPANGVPANPPAVDFCVKILDFGLARFDSERRYATRLTQLGSTLGTVDYMAPEQAESARDADTRSDVYGLGCTLYFLLTGKPPFPGASIAEKVAARLAGGPPSVREARPEVPAELDGVLRRMMARPPADRFQTPAEVAAALQPFTTLTPAVANVPRMELDDRPPLAAPVAPAADMVPMAQPITPQDGAAAADVPLAQPIAADPPPGEDPIGNNEPRPFWLSSGDAGEAAGTDNQPQGHAPGTPRNAPAPGKGGRDRRLVVGLAVGAATLFVLLFGCGGWLVVSWLGGGGGAKAETHPAGAEIQITDAFLSTMDDTIKMGKRINVIVKIRRVKFDGAVELRVEGLPAGVTATDKKVILKSGGTAIEVPIIASFNIDPADTKIRVIATSKNLTTEKTIPLKVIPDKKTLK